MSYKITRESTNLFIKMALPNLMNEGFRASGIDFHSYVNNTAHNLQVSRQTVLNWISGETMPDAADFTFICWKMSVFVGVNDSGYFEILPVNSTDGGKNRTKNFNQ